MNTKTLKSIRIRQVLMLLVLVYVTSSFSDQCPVLKDDRKIVVPIQKPDLFAKYEWEFSLLEPEAKSDLSFSDESLDITFEWVGNDILRGPQCLAFWITNKTAKTVQLDWSKSSMEALSGKPRMVWRANEMNHVSFGDSPENLYLKPTEKIGDGMVAQDCIQIREVNAYYDEAGNWHDAWTEIVGWNLFNGEDLPDYGYEQLKKFVQGKYFVVTMTFIIDGESKPYDFKFRIDDIVKQNPFKKS